MATYKVELRNPSHPTVDERQVQADGYDTDGAFVRFVKYDINGDVREQVFSVRSELVLTIEQVSAQ